MGITGKEKDRLITIAMSGNSAEEIRKETLAALQNSDRFKEYLENQADLEVRASRLNPNFTTDIYDKSLANVNEKITNLEDAMAKEEVAGTLTDKDRESIKKTLDSYNSYKTNLENNYKANPESTENNLLKENTVHNRLASEAAAMGDIYAFDEIDYAVFGGKGITSKKTNPLSSNNADTVLTQGGMGDSLVPTLKANITSSEEKIKVTAEKLINQEESPITATLLHNLINPDGVKDLTYTEGLDKHNLDTFSKDSELYTGQMNNVLQAYKDNKDNIEGFKNDLKSYGIPIKEEYINSLFKQFSTNPTMLSDLDKTVTGLGEENNHLSTLKGYNKAVNNVYMEEKQTKEFFQELEKVDAFGMKNWFFQEKKHLGKNPWAAGFKPTNTVFDREVWGDSQIIPGQNLPLTFAEVAKKAGYSSVQDAVAKGYDWQTLPDGTKVDAAKFNPVEKFKYSGDELESTGESLVKWSTDPKYIKTTAELFENHRTFVVEEDPKKYNKEAMIYKYSGNKKIENRLENILRGTDDVISQMLPAFTEDWEEIPGFENISKNESTVKLKDGGNFTPVMIGDKLMYELDYTYEEGDNTIDASVYVDFNNSELANANEREITAALIEDADASTETGNYVKNAAYRTRFDQRFPTNSLNDVYLEALTVPKGGSIMLDKIPISGNGKSGIYMATVVETDSNGKKIIRLKSLGMAQNGYVRDSRTGLKLEFKTAGEAKSYLGETFIQEDWYGGATTLDTYIQ